jgi:hypothetical protein
MRAVSVTIVTVSTPLFSPSLSSLISWCPEKPSAACNLQKARRTFHLSEVGSILLNNTNKFGDTKLQAVASMKDAAAV